MVKIEKLFKEQVDRDASLGGISLQQLLQGENVDQLYAWFESGYLSRDSEFSEEFKKGIMFCIQKLRDLKSEDLKDWAHSRDIKFAPVELSDYILIQYRKYELEKSKKDA
jgi:hypothetical protein